MSLKYFVWISGLRGPEPQVWNESLMTVGGKPVPVLAQFSLAEADYGTTLKGLAERYPYEAK